MWLLKMGIKKVQNLKLCTFSINFSGALNYRVGVGAL